jgi:uncharacterized protein YjbI with pentapeptide repeats
LAESDDTQRKLHLDLLRAGVEEWNKFRSRQENRDRRLDLRELGLSRAALSGADLSGADLRWARLRAANLSGANFRGAQLRVADFSGANLARADLRAANLFETSFRLADLGGTDLTGAMVGQTVFGDTDLSTVIGLAECVHDGPSILDFTTLVQSGSLPIQFLRGCGLPDTLITFLPSLLNQPIQFYSCFISYSTTDQEFAERLHADLQNRGIRCWFAPHDMQGGKKIHEQIDAAIRVYDRLLLILSPSSMRSEWVQTEIAKARKREKQENRRMLFPVRLVGFRELQEWQCFDADLGKDSAREIREYCVPDFSKGI